MVLVAQTELCWGSEGVLDAPMQRWYTDFLSTCFMALIMPGAAFGYLISEKTYTDLRSVRVDQSGSASTCTCSFVAVTDVHDLRMCNPGHRAW